MADGLSGDAVFTELVHELAVEDIVEELIDLREEAAVWRLFPGGAPENRKNLNSGEERTVAVSEVRRRRGGSGRGFRPMQGNNTDRMFLRLRRFLPGRL